MKSVPAIAIENLNPTIATGNHDEVVGKSPVEERNHRMFSLVSNPVVSNFVKRPDRDIFSEIQTLLGRVDAHNARKRLDDGDVVLCETVNIVLVSGEYIIIW